MGQRGQPRFCGIGSMGVPARVRVGGGVRVVVVRPQARSPDVLVTLRAASRLLVPGLVRRSEISSADRLQSHPRDMVRGLRLLPCRRR